MSGLLEFRLNGEPVQLDSVSPNTTLLEWLRARGLTGSKEGCAEGDCGACSVAIVDLNTNGERRYRAINSCLVPVALMAGRDIVTIEGVANGKLHPVQRTMVENHGSQCGYCTPGFVMSLFEGYYRKNLKTRAQLDEQLAGNLCRCTGYRPINVAAAEAFACKIDNDRFEAPLKDGPLNLGSIRYALNGENFLRPTSLTELFAFIAEFPEARLIAGATELGLDISKRFKKFPMLISVEAIPDLTQISNTEKEWRVGGAATLTAIRNNSARNSPRSRRCFTCSAPARFEIARRWAAISQPLRQLAIPRRCCSRSMRMLFSRRPPENELCRSNNSLLVIERLPSNRTKF